MTTATTFPTVDADPYPWPYDGAIDPATTALVMIDWQTDFCGPGGYVDTMGYDLNLTRSGLVPTAAVLAAVRPEPIRALYFVARGDGSSEVSDDLAAHNRAVNKYQRGR